MDVPSESAATYNLAFFYFVFTSTLLPQSLLLPTHWNAHGVGVNGWIIHKQLVRRAECFCVMCHKIKRPADLSIAKRLGGFSCCKNTNIFPSRNHFDEKTCFSPLPNPDFIYFCSCQAERKRLTRESAFFALFLGCESGQFA